MADSSVAVTPGAGILVDTRTVGTDHRQVVAIGDPDGTQVAAVDAMGNLEVTVRGGTRYSVAQICEAYSVTASDALIPVTGRSIDRATAVTSAYTVTTGRVFRLQAIIVSITLLGTTVAATRLRLRAAAGAAASTSSPVQASWRVGNWSIGTQAASYTQQTEVINFPDGMEFAAGTGLAFSASATTAAMHSLDLTFVGYEYVP